MSKSKEQCVNIINQKVKKRDFSNDNIELILSLESVIKEICDSEYVLLWLLEKDNTIRVINSDKVEAIILKPSIIQSTLVSKKGFFDNYIVSHKEYNQTIDNPLNIKIKSMLIVPILDKSKNRVEGFISVFNSVNFSGGLQRYDIRSLNLLNSDMYDMMVALKKTTLTKTVALKQEAIKKEPTPIKKASKKKTVKPIKIVDEKKMLPLKVKGSSKRKTKADLENELELEKKKIIALEKELKSKNEILRVKEDELLEYAITVVDDEVDACSDLNTILSFLNNEVSYLAHEEHKLYLFLEIIKNSLHNKEQLHFLNYELEKSQLIETLANSLYTREKMPLLSEEFNVYQFMNDIVALYGKAFGNNNITFNLFLNPNIPNFLISDVYKLKSLVIHLLNNIFSFTTATGAIELNLNYSKDRQLLTLEIKAFMNKSTKKNIKSFFNNQKVSHSLTSSDNGLGLSVSTNLVNMLGGKLKLATIGETEHSFTAILPMLNVKEKEERLFHKKVIKVAILMNDSNHYAMKNLVKYLIALGIDEKFILTFQTAKKMSNIKFSHLFCFENMYSSELSFDNFSSVSILKHNDKDSDFLREHDIREDFNILLVNTYYGLELQKIFFPEMKSKNLEENTLIVEDSFLSKFSNVVKKIKLS